MENIAELDKNFKIETKIEKSDIKFYNVRSAPFKVYGIFYAGDRFRRLPEAVAKSVSKGVYGLHAHTAGGRVRFRTDSPYVAIHAKMPHVGRMPHFALCGSSGFDLYVQDRYRASFVPPVDIVDGFEGVKPLGLKRMREITINFPSYSNVSELYIGLQEDAVVEAPTPYKLETPILFYGSSITQGGCSSRPGSAYANIVSRALDADIVNLGFSGNARAEVEMGEYVKDLPMSVFVYDYDHNAPTIAHLEQSHERMFRQVREAQPDLPIVLMSRPKYTLNEDDRTRLEIIRKTYENALERGDRNVYLIDGPTLMAIAGNEGTVDGTHPTDLGFFSMAQALIPVLKEILK